MTEERYTCEDYVRDFEFDYLGFAGVPDGLAANPGTEKTDENGSEPNAGESGLGKS